MKRIAVLLFVILGIKTAGYSQDFALKTNGLYWATTTLNMGVEKAISNQVTLEADVAYNPWTFREDKKMHLLLVQPEMKYWLCEKYEGHFVGIHLHGAQFFGGFGSKLYDGYLAGGGVTYGYDWILSPHWNLEAAIGLGVGITHYTKYNCEKCASAIEKKTKAFVMPTKLAVSLVYNLDTKDTDKPN